MTLLNVLTKAKPKVALEVMVLFCELLYLLSKILVIPFTVPVIHLTDNFDWMSFCIEDPFLFLSGGRDLPFIVLEKWSAFDQ